MNAQVQHMRDNKHLLEIRSSVLGAIRTFFKQENFVEIDAPNLLALPGQEPYLSPMSVRIENERGEFKKAYLHTSPEYTMKKALAAGFTHIYFLGKTYRNQESFGGLHNPEFTMLEWYRANASFFDIIRDIQMMWERLQGMIDPKAPLKGCVVRHMRDVWKEYVGVNLDAYLTTEALRELCIERGYKPAQDERYEDLFYRVFLNEIEPTLGMNEMVVVHGYPVQMAALAAVSEEDARYADRFELYYKGIELANGFQELTDADEQRARLEEEQILRKTLEKEVYPLDESFLEAVAQMPKSAGVALGVDRLIMALTGCQDIDSVLVLPASKQFKQQ